WPRPSGAILTTMDNYAGCARLEWWTNPSTCLTSLDVRIQVTATEPAWRATATVVEPMTVEDREGLAVLTEIGPPFTLDFADGSTIDVRCEGTDDQEHILLTRWEADG